MLHVTEYCISHVANLKWGRWNAIPIYTDKTLDVSHYFIENFLKKLDSKRNLCIFFNIRKFFFDIFLSKWCNCTVMEITTCTLISGNVLTNTNFFRHVPKQNSVKLIFFLHWYPWTRKKSVGGRHEAFGKVIFKCQHFRALMSAFFSQKCVVVRIIVVSAFDLPVLCSLLLHTIDAIILVWVQRYCHVLEYNSSLEDLCQSIAKCWNNKVLF